MPETILVVDDEPNVEPLIRQIFRRQIRQQKLVFFFAHDGVEALSQIQAEPNIDIVLTDIRMPQMDGLALLTKLGELKPMLNPVLTTAVLSAYDDMENIRKAMNAGAFDFLPKPLDYEDLRITLDKLIQHVQHFKQAQETVRRTQNELTHAYAALEESNQRLQELDKLKSDFINVITHELRSPFVNISFSLELLERYGREELPPDLLAQLAELRKGIQTARKMVDNLVNFAQFLSKQGEMQQTTLDFTQLVEDSVLPLRGLAQSNGVTLEMELGGERPLILADPAHIADAIYHLVHNAIRFSPEGGIVWVRVQQKGTAVSLTVQDTGAGIPSDKLSTLWDGFSQLADPLLRGVEGLDLGLSLVKYIVKAHNGELFAESQIGQGSTFGFAIPI
jgi:signal transduction histidine kinase